MILLLTFMAQWPKKDLTFNQGAKKKKKFHMLKILVWGGGNPNLLEDHKLLHDTNLKSVSHVLDIW